MGNLRDLGQDVEDLSETFKSLEGQQRQFNARVGSLIRDLEACLQDIDGRLKLNQAEHDHIMQDYDNAKSLLQRLNSFISRGSGSRFSNGGTLDFSSSDAQGSDDSPERAAEPGSMGVDAALESPAETDPEQVRLGLQRILRKIGHEVPRMESGAPKPGERRRRQAKP